jgi:hypothetical protein
MEEKSLNVFQRIAAVMRDVEYLKKDTDVGFGSSTYKAISEEKVTLAIRNALIKHGVAIIPTGIEHIRSDEVLPTKNGGKAVSRFTTVNTTYRVQNVDTPSDYIDVVSAGTGVDTQDKGVGKALTYAYKYMLLRLFAIPTGEDTDKTHSEAYNAQFASTVDTTRWDEKLKELFVLRRMTSQECNEFSSRYGLDKSAPQEVFKAAYEELLQTKVGAKR